MSDLSFRFIIPCYNSAPYIKQCIESILAQDYQYFKIIVADDMSIDGSANIVQQMIDARTDGKIQLHIAAKKSYAGGCRNIGMQYEKDTDYTWFVDSDDYLANSSVLKQIADVLSSNSLPDIFAFQYLIDFDGKICQSGSYDIVKAFQIGASLTNCTCAPWAKVYKTSKCLPFEENIFWGEDAMQTLMTLDTHPTIIQSMNFRPYVYRQVTTSMTNTLAHDKAKKTREVTLFNDRLETLLPKCKDIHTKLCIVNKIKFELEKIIRGEI